MTDLVDGLALAELVIEKVRQEPTRSMFDYFTLPWVDGEPSPMGADELAEVRFPSGRPLSPSLRAWLAFDTSLFDRFGWFDENGDLAPRTLAELVADEYGEPWTEVYAPVAGGFPECFLLPGGSDSRRVLTVGEPDATGEYPVLALDIDDMPFVGLMYPGFDVYLAETAGLLKLEFESYTSLAEDPRYLRRMHQHGKNYFGGDVCYEYPFD
ncbi:hypothetical protein [Actinokineospora enzanensis]|uniref:hypothetical protein n=1 Tax=Actinokineospora enzanensis TaxID=155975 RepID=UPI00035D1A8A|nr:hypothetical protein [Actinokineospora enzanensis]